MTEIRFSQSVEYPLTAKDTTIIGGTVSSKNGIGSGNFLVGYRRQTSDKGWLQVISHNWFFHGKDLIKRLEKIQCTVIFEKKLVVFGI